LRYEDKFHQMVTQSLNTLKNLLKQMDVPTSIADEAMFTLEVAFDDIYCSLFPFFNIDPYLSKDQKESMKANGGKAKESSELERIGEAPALRRIPDEDHSGYIQSFPY